LNVRLRGLIRKTDRLALFDLVSWADAIVTTMIVGLAFCGMHSHEPDESDLGDNDRNDDQHRQVVDGQQRLRTIWGFIDGAFSLARDADPIGSRRQARPGNTGSGYPTRSAVACFCVMSDILGCPWPATKQRSFFALCA
jgi:hypothetical protein